MKKILLLISLFSVYLSKSQIVFCPPGAQWNYTFNHIFNYNEVLNETIKCIGTTTENGDVISLLTHRRFFSEQNPEIYLTYTTSIKQKGDTIYMRNSFTSNKWQILYNFAAQVGHSWSNSFTSGNTFTTTVTAKGTATVANTPVKQLSVKYAGNYPYLIYTGVINERFGSDRFLFNYASRQYQGGDLALDYLCYKDDVFGIKQFTSKPCNYGKSLGLLEEDNIDDSIILFPNPVNNYFKLQVSENFEIKKIIIVNALGQVVNDSVNLTNNRLIDVTNLPKGIYFLLIESENYMSSFKKFIKE